MPFFLLLFFFLLAHVFLKKNSAEGIMKNSDIENEVEEYED